MTTTSGRASLQRIAEGREAEIFAWGDDAVLKLYRSAEWTGSRALEAAAMTAAGAAGGPVPAFRGFTEIDGRPGMIMSRAEGIDLLTSIEKKPWTVIGVGPIMARAQAALHAARGPDELPTAKDRMRRHIAGSALVPDQLRAPAMASLDQLPDGDRLLHGDFHPGNIVMTGEGPVVIDWPNATRGDPAADIARTVLMLRLGELPEGSPRLIRVLAAGARRIILARYLRAYASERPIDRAMVDRWMYLVAVHRFSEAIAQERPRLLRLIEGLGAASGAALPRA